jgi:hypothetical protein
MNVWYDGVFEPGPSSHGVLDSCDAWPWSVLRSLHVGKVPRLEQH